jgi:hypothetical protein
MGGSNLHKLTCCEVEVGSCSICWILLTLGNSEVQIHLNLTIIVLYLHKDPVCLCFITLDLTVEAIDFNCSMIQLVYKGMSLFRN